MLIFSATRHATQVTPPPPKHTAATAALTASAQGKPSPPAAAPAASAKASEQQSDCLFVGFFPGFAPNRDQILAVRTPPTLLSTIPSPDRGMRKAALGGHRTHTRESVWALVCGVAGVRQGGATAGYRHAPTAAQQQSAQLRVLPYRDGRRALPSGAQGAPFGATPTRIASVRGANQHSR